MYTSILYRNVAVVEPIIVLSHAVYPLTLLLLLYSFSCNMYRAIRRGNLAEVKRFLDEGGSIETVGGRYHGSLLLESCRHHTIKVAELLLDRGANVNVSGGGFWTPLHYASDGQENAALVIALIRRGVEVDAVDFHGRMSLHIASRQGSSRVAAALLEAGAEPNVVDDDKRTPMHYAAANGRREVMAVLLGFGGDFSALDRELETPLHRATRQGQRTAMSLLHRAGADPAAVNCWGELAGTLAPNYKMNPVPRKGRECDELVSGPCIACSAKRGRHYYFCKSEILQDIPGSLIIGSDGFPVG